MKIFVGNGLKEGLKDKLSIILPASVQVLLIVEKEEK